ncbi:uncharacterized protein LOC135154964 [Lytechinus pictus]|uniref:uncharacterized protein LOC135154964 n=1 Tax=Lytechinus pictus TaxID=7653 RepID=UPI0030BA0634
MMANQYIGCCIENAREGARCRRQPLPGLQEFRCWQHVRQPAAVQCSAHVEVSGIRPGRRDRRRSSRRRLHRLGGDAGNAFYCTLHRENDHAEVVPAYRQRLDERRRREEELERLHPRPCRQRSPRLVACEIAAAAAAQLQAAREQRRDNHRAN